MQGTSKLNVFMEYIQFRWIPLVRTLIRRDQGHVIDQFQELAQRCAECVSKLRISACPIISIGKFV